MPDLVCVAVNGHPFYMAPDKVGSYKAWVLERQPKAQIHCHQLIHLEGPTPYHGKRIVMDWFTNLYDRTPATLTSQSPDGSWGIQFDEPIGSGKLGLSSCKNTRLMPLVNFKSEVVVVTPHSKPWLQAYQGALGKILKITRGDHTKRRYLVATQNRYGPVLIWLGAQDLVNT